MTNNLVINGLYNSFSILEKISKTMKRSAAPSQQYKKVSKFVTPYRRPENLASVASPKTVESDPQKPPCGSSTKDITPTTVATGNESDVEIGTTSTNHVASDITTTLPIHKVSFTKFRAPLQQLNSNEAAPMQSTADPSVRKKYLSVVWCKRSTKKHKNWEGKR